MPVGVGVGEGDGEEGGFEEIDTLPPQALITNETKRIGAERKIGQRLELAVGVIEGRLFTERIGVLGVFAQSRPEAHVSYDAGSLIAGSRR